jgi:hypothetical protein
MSRNRWLPALLAVTTLAAGCAGGSTPSAPPLAQQGISDSAQPSQHFKTTTAPAEAIKKIDESVDSTSQSPTWQFLEPLQISDTGTFSLPRNVTTCSPIDPIFGIWYIALDSFTLPMNSVSLPSCAVAAPAWKGWTFAKKRTAGAPAAGSYSNLYIVELSVGLFSTNVTPIAGPVVANGSAWDFQPMESSLSFTRFSLYSFFVASYNGPTFAQPNVTCEPGSTTCSLASNPTPGNKLVAIVSDGSGALPSVVVKDSAGNALTQETISPNCGHCVAVYDETVPSGITGTVSYTSGGSVYYPNESAVYELANVTSGRFASSNTAGVPSSLAATISGVTNFDIQLCAYIQSDASASNITLGFSNGSSETYDYQSTGAVFGHETATATASSSCTANNINTGYEAGMAYADYP